MTTSSQLHRMNGAPLAWRLTAAFLVVAISAIVVVAGVTLYSSRNQLSSLVLKQHEEDLRTIAATVADSYHKSDGWPGTDLTAAEAIAARVQATLSVTDANGNIVHAHSQDMAGMMANMHGIETVNLPRGHEHLAAVIVDGKQVGSVALRFPVGSLPGPEGQVRDALERTVLISTAIAILVAVIIATYISRRLTGGIHSLADTARRLAGGDLSARSELSSAPGELAMLGSTFDTMAHNLEKEDALRRQLSADVAHELRTPLAVLQAQTEALVDGISEPDVATLQSLHEETLRLGRLVGDMESLAAAEAASMNLNKTEIDLAELAQRSLTLTPSSFREASLTVSSDLRPAPVFADEDRLMQVITNLMSNALRYTSPGGAVYVATLTEDGHSVFLVSNDAESISDEDLQHVFDRFWRGRQSAGTTGSGIGLAVVAELVKAHDGTVTARNDSRNVVFRVELPEHSTRNEGVS